MGKQGRLRVRQLVDFDTADTLVFSVLENIRPMIETVPLENAAESYARMMRGEARFRIVLLTGADAVSPHDFN